MENGDPATLTLLCVSLLSSSIAASAANEYAVKAGFLFYFANL